MENKPMLALVTIDVVFGKAHNDILVTRGIHNLEALLNVITSLTDFALLKGTELEQVFENNKGFKLMVGVTSDTAPGFAGADYTSLASTIAQMYGIFDPDTVVTITVWDLHTPTFQYTRIA